MTMLQVKTPDAPVVVRELHSLRCEVSTTDGDGVCAIHTVLGEKHRGVFHKKSARKFLRDTLGPTADDFTRRLADGRILTELQHVLWQELLKPCVTKVT